MVKEAYLSSRPRYTLLDLDKVEFSPTAGCMEVQLGVSANYLL